MNKPELIAAIGKKAGTINADAEMHCQPLLFQPQNIFARARLLSIYI
jgi:hypothetical protein